MRKPCFIEERVAARDQAVRQHTREFEKRVRREAVAQIGDDFRMTVVLSHDTNRIEILLNDEVNAAHRIGETADRERCAECKRRRAAAPQDAKDAAFLRLASGAGDLFCEGVFSHNK